MYDIFFDLNNMHQAVDDDEDGHYWHIGEHFDWEYDYQDDNAVVVKEYGCTCPSCGEFYPYAEVRENFKCWACRNF